MNANSGPLCNRLVLLHLLNLDEFQMYYSCRNPPENRCTLTLGGSVACYLNAAKIKLFGPVQACLPKPKKANAGLRRKQFRCQPLPAQSRHNLSITACNFFCTSAARLSICGFARAPMECNGLIAETLTSPLANC
jgi:hypothetical protein